MKKKLLNPQITSFVVLALLLICTTLITFVTYLNRHHTNDNFFIDWALQNHLGIMIVLLFTAIGFGFLWSKVTSTALKNTKKSSKQLLDTILLFLNPEERAIIRHLVANQGKGAQAKIAHLEGMNRVKAFRSLQRLQEKNIVEITAQGKIRHVHLKDNILHLLLDS